MIHNIVSISGGKDSTAMALLAIERETENLRFVFADTGHEHRLTYDYVDYLSGELERRCGVGIERVRADFSRQIEKRRHTVATKWRAFKPWFRGKASAPMKAATAETCQNLTLKWERGNQSLKGT